MSVLTLSRARGSDAPLLTRLIRAGKAHWGYPAEWLDAWKSELSISPEQIEAWYVCTASFQGNWWASSPSHIMTAIGGWSTCGSSLIGLGTGSEGSCSGTPSPPLPGSGPIASASRPIPTRKGFIFTWGPSATGSGSGHGPGPPASCRVWRTHSRDNKRPNRPLHQNCRATDVPRALAYCPA